MVICLITAARHLQLSPSFTFLHTQFRMKTFRQTKTRTRKTKTRTRKAKRGGASYAGKNVLVTGGAGFIGSNLVDALLAAGATVRVLDNLVTGKMENLQNAQKSGSFEFIKGDITSAEDCAKACEGMNVVFHEAALVSVPISMNDPILNHNVNITGTLNMLIAAANAGVSRFVYASSAATYGALEKLPKEESDPRDYPSPYALSKGVDEDYATLWARDERLGKGMTCVGLRYFNVYGPRQDPRSPYSGVISIFANKISQNLPITFFGDGKQTRDFVFVADVVHANMLAGITTLPTSSRVYNVGTGKSVTLLELKERMESIAQTHVDVAFEAPRPGDIVHSRSNIRLIREELGYEPQFSLEEGLTALMNSL